MKCIKSLGLVAITLSLTACGGIKSQAEITQMSPTEVAVLACNAYKNIELEQLQFLFPEKAYKKFISKTSKYPEKFAAYVENANCKIKNTESITYKKIDSTRITFEKFDVIKVFKVDGQYQIAVEG
ncbi:MULTISPECIES: hypothetical protein [unclassified Colwellia]|uniref:hypothetical protein n=1 Tax=unclassified Colwellia TaxID=196834 RepID=UPI0015F63F14|nr:MULTISPECIES: hypothetical protein [unclassified Colwellia]MBA6356637.1 hypothetical protein [Colwellia sp. BRX8-3]MBA6360945.1 hypothetical protein [Colwellia sp. BRX8-6]MBA6368389.1 hypothetical protein [Colwellia sp. BRX8-5]MBA6375411.1 hypothetical protein [Colwellia sp. BRX8-2]